MQRALNCSLSSTHPSTSKHHQLKCTHTHTHAHSHTAGGIGGVGCGGDDVSGEGTAQVTHSSQVLARARPCSAVLAHSGESIDVIGLKRIHFHILFAMRGSALERRLNKYKSTSPCDEMARARGARHRFRRPGNIQNIHHPIGPNSSIVYFGERNACSPNVERRTSNAGTHQTLKVLRKRSAKW